MHLYIAAAINDLIQFNMVTTGKCIHMHLIADTYVAICGCMVIATSKLHHYVAIAS